MGWRTAYESLGSLARSPLHDKLITSDEESYLAWVLVCVVPFTRAPGQDLSGNLKKAPPAATLAAREGIKAPNKVSELITAAARNREEIVSLRDIVSDGDARVNERDLFGMAIRRWEAHGKHWRLQVLYAMLDEVMMQARSSSTDELQESWVTLIEHLEKLNLMDAANLKPLVDGRKLSQTLGIKPGKWMTPAMDVCMAWQLRNPDESDPAGAVEEVRRRKDELGIAGLLKD